MKNPFPSFFVFYFTILFIQNSIHAQPIIEWDKSFGTSGWDDARSILQTPDGGYIVSAYAATNDGDASDANSGGDAWLIKLDNDGNVEWQNNYGGSGSDSGEAMLLTDDGGYILAGGSTSSDGDVGSNNGNLDVWIVKISGNGSLEWEKNYGGTDAEWASDIQKTSDGGYIVSGGTSSNDGDVSNGVLGLNDCWVLKLDAQGGLEWEKTYGGSNRESARSIKQTADGGYIFAGFSESMDGDVNGTDIFADYWIVKLDATGDIVWKKSFGGSNADDAHDIQLTSDGGYVVFGYAWSTDGDVVSNDNDPISNGDYWIVKLNAAGDIEWENTFGGTNLERGHSFAMTTDGGFILAGYCYSIDGDVTNNLGLTDYWIVKLDPQGILEWQKTYGGSNEDEAWCIQQTSDGGYIVLGKTWSTDGDLSTNNGLSDVWVVKLTPLTIATNDLEQNASINVFPNPSNGNFSISLEDINEPVTLQIFDAHGRSIYVEKSTEAQINIESFPKGIYWIYVIGEEVSIVKKIVVN